MAVSEPRGGQAGGVPATGGSTPDALGASSAPDSGQIGSTGIDTASVTVAALSQALTSGALTSTELTAFYLERMARLNPDLRAVISVCPDAQAQAEAADRRRAEGAGTGPLAGIPVLIKDNIAAAGSPATAGSPALLEAAAADAFLISELRAAGAVILAKANLSEWANFRSDRSSSGWSTLGGQAVNPHGTGRNPSGSSSGSAVAVAAGMAPLAVGTETDGSIISPSHVCGIVGLKPTVGLVSRSGIVPISLEQDTAGPMTRCVADAAVLLGALAGADPADPATAVAPDRTADYTRYLDPGALAGARIGIWRSGAARALPATAAILDQVAVILAAQGAQVIDPVELPGADDIQEPEFTALTQEFKTDLNSYLAGLGGEHPRSLAELIEFNSRNGSSVLAVFGQEIFERAEQTGGRSDPAWQAARSSATRLARTAIDTAIGGSSLDAIVTLSGDPAWLTDHVLGDHVQFGTSGPAAVAGYPAITVPAGWVNGLPVGASFFGPAWSEGRLIGLAYAFEQAGMGQR